EGAGLYVTYLVLMMYSGRLYPVTVPENYTDIFGHPVAAITAAAASAEAGPAKEDDATKPEEKPASGDQ
ncbi:MAG: hypothetical protein JF571_00130, partial [Asticcacaulis sp.]|nr:hypothetical protein [Asticcacaulis sp.]